MKYVEKSGTRRLVQLALLIAITLVMAFTPLGYFRTPVLSVSFLTVPVAIGAIVLGPAAGALLGLTFGLTSFYDAFVGGGLKSALLAISPAGCFVVTVVARVLCGWLCGLVFAGCKKLLHGGKSAYVLGALSCPLFNTVFFMGFLMLLFYRSETVQNLCAKFGTANPLTLILLMVGVQGLIEFAVCGVLGSVISLAVAKALKLRK